jgi:hypothetical protein
MDINYKEPVLKLVVVEDYLSAIRVSEWMDCMPLFGSHLDKKTAVRLATMYNDIYLWLDPDKAAQAMKFKKEYEAIFDNFHVILSDKDPKEYQPNDIYDYLADAEAGISNVA